MSTIAIRVDNLSKQYRLGKRKGYKTFRETILGLARSPWARKDRATTDQTFWALKDVNFELKQGEVLGIIGRNGAGKSTLLKVLSRITEPTLGRVETTGRVGSLLEVGTGFHPELTGRENVFLNGAILGMRRAEIAAKFDEIVAFAEVDKFLDTPVKYYSSGMYMRLAFGVAAHLEPEILIVDEVLAVGDARFQKKCLGKMQDVGKSGRTVLFVSHNMSAIQALCSRAIVMQQGSVLVNESASLAVQAYLRDAAQAADLSRPIQAGGQPTLTKARANVFEHDGRPRARLDLEISSREQRPVSIDVRLVDRAGQPVGFGSLGSLAYDQMIQISTGRNQLSIEMPVDRLGLGSYMVGIDLTLPNVQHYDRADNAVAFDIHRAPSGGADRVLSQSWGYGSYEIPLRLVPSEEM